MLTIPGLSFPYDNKKNSDELHRMSMMSAKCQKCFGKRNILRHNVRYVYTSSCCRRAHVLLTLFMFVSAQWCPTYIVMCFWFFFLRLYCQREREREREREKERVCLFICTVVTNIYCDVFCFVFLRLCCQFVWIVNC